MCASMGKASEYGKEGPYKSTPADPLSICQLERKMEVKENHTLCTLKKRSHLSYRVAL